MYKLIFLIALVFLNKINCLNFCGDWTQYKDIKCIKVLEKIGTEEEALSNCTQLKQGSTLITIQNKEEQEFLNNLMKKYHNISDNIWIGMKYINQSYQWSDGSTIKYSNWADDAVRDGSYPCVQMSLTDTSFGKWKDESCKRKSLFVCQKTQELNLNSLKEIMENMSKVIENQQDQIQKLKATSTSTTQALNKQEKEYQEMKNSMIPLGFLYTQLPNQTTPQQLWPNLKWTEVTKDYAGLFFRAEGSGSEPFGQTQQANQSWISDIVGTSYLALDKGKYFCQKVHLTQNKWTVLSPSHAINYLYFYTTSGEVRPKNAAIEIWKRNG